MVRPDWGIELNWEKRVSKKESSWLGNQKRMSLVSK